MKRNIYIFILSALVLSGCNAFLEPDRDNVYGRDDILKYQDKAEGVLLNAYHCLPGGVNFTDVATPDAVSNNNGNSYRKITNGEWASDNNPFSVWDNAYNAIAYCNHFIDKIVDNVAWAEDDWTNRNYRQKLTAEARGLRAFFYIQLLEAHAGVGVSGNLLGVPMIMNDSEFDKVSLSRPSYDECVKLVVEDLDYAAEN